MSPVPRRRGSRSLTPLANGTDVAATRRACADLDTSPLVVRDALRDIPALRDPGVSDYEATSLLREWTATWISLAVSTETEIEPAYWREDIDTLYGRFRASERGAFCGDAAWTLMKVYGAFGLDSWVYSYGVADPKAILTHAVTLVDVGDKIVVQDAHVNDALVDVSSDAIDVRELLRRLAAGRAATIARDEPASDVPRSVLLSQRDWLRAEHAMRIWPHDERANLQERTTTENGFIKCSVAGVRFARLRPWVDRVNARNPGLLDSLRGRGWEEKLLYLMLRPIGLASDSDGWVAPGGAEDTPTGALLAQIAAAAAAPTPSVDRASPGRRSRPDRARDRV